VGVFRKPCRKYMNVRYLKSSKACERSTTFCLIAILGVFSVSVQQQCRAQSSLDSNMFSGSAANWISGPQALSVGNYADIQVPLGYRWVDGQAARAVLESQNNPVPDDLIGVIAPDSGKWWAVVEFAPDGYLKDAKEFSSAVAVKYAETALNNQRAKQGLSSITSLDWQSKPVYDAQAHTLTWSLQVETASSKALDERLVMLGRHGILQITAIQTYPFTDAPFLKGLASDVAFKDGERYTDYQSGDKIASIGMEELITGDNEANMAATHGFGGSAAALVYAGLGACALVGGLVIVRQRKKHHRPARVPVAATAGHKAAHASNGSNGGAALKNGQSAAPVAAKAALNQGQRKEVVHAHRGRRKKVFNYPKFYTNVMRELSLHSYGPGIPMANGKSSNGHANGQVNGHANGHANGSNGHANGANVGNGVNEAIKSEIVELIASQKNLIQEQKLLLEQQTRLIEEKRWLIEEQTAFLKGQSDQQFPLKFE
jgi:uncharacterized membrane-anchored protein